MFANNLLLIVLFVSYREGRRRAAAQVYRLDLRGQRRFQHKLCRGNSDQVSDQTPKENRKTIRSAVMSPRTLTAGKRVTEIHKNDVCGKYICCFLNVALKS